MTMVNKPFVPNTMENVEVSWAWVSTSQGLINWTFKNPNSVPVNFVLYRGVSVDGSAPENMYLFGDAFYPLYYQNFQTPFQTGQPSPLVSSATQPPLSMFKSPDGTIQAAFIFTLKAKGSWSMEEGGWVDGMTPAGAVAIPVSYSETAKFSVNYNKAISCEQYNQQAGTNYPCPPDPFTVESALFMLPKNVAREVSSDVITMVGSSPAPTGGNGSSGSCMSSLISALEGGNLREVVQAIECLLEEGALTLKEMDKERFDKLKASF